MLTTWLPWETVSSPQPLGAYIHVQDEQECMHFRGEGSVSGNSFTMWPILLTSHLLCLLLSLPPLSLFLSPLITSSSFQSPFLFLPLICLLPPSPLPPYCLLSFPPPSILTPDCLSPFPPLTSLVISPSFSSVLFTLSFRKVKDESATGSSTSNRVRTNLTISVEAVEFDTAACELRVKGKNIQENQYVKVGVLFPPSVLWVHALVCDSLLFPSRWAPTIPLTFR